MPSVTITYLPESNTFIADDDHQNKISFKADRESEGIISSSSGKTLGPMVSLLMACGACSGIDIVMILNKQRQTFDSLTIKVSGEREKDKTPALWEAIHIEYIIGGNVEKEKAERAAELSVDKYCSVAETLRRSGASISYSVTVI